MSTKTASRGTSTSSSAHASDGSRTILLPGGALSLCLLVSRRHGHVRVFDFRGGPTPQKRSQIVAAAKQVDARRVFSLVEEDDVAGWSRLGFAVEGVVPRFYRRSDAWVVGARVAELARRRGEDAADDDLPPGDQEARRRAADAVVTEAAKLLRETGELHLPATRLVRATPQQVQRAVAAAERRGRALGGTELFSREGVREHLLVSALKSGTEKATHQVLVACERVEGSGTVLFELVELPHTDAHRLAATAAVFALCDTLAAEGARHTFTLAPANDVPVCATLLAAGFRRSGLLHHHLHVEGEPRDALVWSRELAPLAGAEAGRG
jgi:hypothetical protein